MKQSLQLKMGQHLTMTPQLQQAIRLLQLSTLDLQAEIQEALESNPMLEVTDDANASSQTSETPENEREESNESNENNEISNNAESGVDDQSFSETYEDNIQKEESSSDKEYNADNQEESTQEGEWNEEIPTDLAVDTSWDDVYQSSAPAGPAKSDDEMDFDDRKGTSESLQDHLNWQLNLTPMSVQDRIIAETIIDAVETSGMLGQSIDDIFEGLQKEIEELEQDEVIAVLHRLQQFDPPGICSEDAKDCLLIQLKQHDSKTPGLQKAIELVKSHLELLGSRDFKSLMRKLKIKEPELKICVELIQSLNPHPGEHIGADTTEYVVPDVFVQKKNNRWTVNLNPDIAPKIRVNPGYASLVKRADSSTDNTFLRDNLQEARWFLKSLQSRNETLLKVASCIVDKQQGFLDFGPEAMKPMVLHDVAEIVEMHESTISRVTTQKYMHTPQGIFELKYFFSSHVATESGGECSSTAIRAIIKKLVAAENLRKPLSDSKITSLLDEQGIKVARRTIAKYRESLGIPPSNERKRLV